MNGCGIATLTRGFELQHIWCSVITVALKCTVFELGHGTDRQMDGQSYGIARFARVRYGGIFQRNNNDE